MSLLQKYFCCRTEKELQISRNVVFVSQDEALKSKVLTERNIPSYTLKSNEYASRSAQDLHALSSAEVFRLVETDDDEHTSYNASLPHTIRCLPPALDSKPTLVLDLDNTLIFSTIKELTNFDHKITVNYNGKAQPVWIVERPGLQSFLEHVANKYEVILFTAGIRQYGVKVMKKIDRKMRISYFLDRRFCTLIGKNNRNQDFFSKDLKILGRDLSKVLLVDDRDYSFCSDIDNGILVPIFNGDPQDRCLDCLKEYLDYCSTLDDMRCRKPFEYAQKDNKECEIRAK
ncbi:dullard-like phosphatase domain-containing protein [Vittaforma corneae ATCC 50505]|uniref:Mitochondrial import inner membrane translocase subunit TIM50 n=1 Tax=Vittaforma corneae (strain ATCC 50505) TaxID=993615 RepID=L2GPI0_VITCO|nr:dullard-like phosphatase domain-containing protein [Vittaforma corneae ATCC 50505]ELA42798.1 dullard-like phosphatase domain-containing protein [Vittaforma corneae ATCC 50505]